MASSENLNPLLYYSNSKQPKELAVKVRSNSHTSTLFHYTKTANTLLSILKEGFRFSYCLEDYYLLGNSKIGVPMISFCDIPIHDSVEHSEKYGYYAIGLTKDALFECEKILRQISPVHYYISPDSTKPIFQELENIRRMQKELSSDRFSPVVKQQIKAMKRNEDTRDDGILNEIVQEGRNNRKHILENLDATCIAIGLLKPYISYNRKKKQYQRNYDECEWRIIEPEIWDIDEGNKFSWLWSEQEYETWRGKGAKPFIKQENDESDENNENYAGITFTVDCISFIIVKTEKEIPSFIKRLGKLKTLCGETLTQEQKNLLFSKVISFERIKRDF